MKKFILFLTVFVFTCGAVYAQNKAAPLVKYDFTITQSTNDKDGSSAEDSRLSFLAAPDSKPIYNADIAARLKAFRPSDLSKFFVYAEFHRKQVNENTVEQNMFSTGAGFNMQTGMGINKLFFYMSFTGGYYWNFLKESTGIKGMLTISPVTTYQQKHNNPFYPGNYYRINSSYNVKYPWLFKYNPKFIFQMDATDKTGKAKTDKTYGRIGFAVDAYLYPKFGELFKDNSFYLTAGYTFVEEVINDDHLPDTSHPMYTAGIGFYIVNDKEGMGSFGIGLSYINGENPIYKISKTEKVELTFKYKFGI